MEASHNYEQIFVKACFNANNMFKNVNETNLQLDNIHSFDNNDKNSQPSFEPEEKNPNKISNPLSSKYININGICV